MMSLNGVKPRALLRGALTAMAMTLAATAAQAFQISPISQDFTPSGRDATQSFQIINERDEQVTVSVSVTTRDMDADGRETETATGDFNIFPSEVVVPPKGTQIVRAKWVGNATPKTELAYRIIAEEVPLKARRDTPGASIYMTVRYVGALYVVPRGVRADVKVISAKQVTGTDGKPKLELMLENRGTAHTILDDPTLTVTAGGVTKKLTPADLNGTLPQENVLAQHQRRFLVAWPDGLAAGPVQASLAYNNQR